VARRRRSSKKIVLNKYKLWLGLIILGWLYFFTLFLAQESPTFVFLQTYAQIAFGEVGLTIFFGLCLLAGILIMIKGHLIKQILRLFWAVLILISAMINFPIVDGETSSYEQLWWYISRPILWILDQAFGGQDLAIKVFVVILFVMLIVRLLYVFNFSLPNININISQDKAPRANKSTASRHTTYASQSANKQDEKTDGHAMGQPLSPGVLKKIIRQKMDEKILEKEPKTTLKINYSKDKPTFDTSIMHSGVGQSSTIDERFLMEKAKALQDKLMEFNVPIRIEGFDIWPSIVQIRIKPDAGIKISTIAGLKNDIASSLRVKSMRIIAPIPGTDAVGIQIPNPKPTIVRLWDMLSSAEFASAMKKSETNLTLGKAIDGSVVIKSLEDMPHLLVAGATGSGKSVGINDFILSLMYQNTPSELKFLMVDPKQVELEFYSGLPYLLGPIVTDAEKALRLLKRSVNEMENRYTKLKEKRVKHIDEYNKKVMGDKMYRIVFVIDELADLMMSGSKKEVEICITRIAQKARAVWMHLIVATQRPSVNVITGLIKANIPTRIAFGVVSEIDSRTILGKQGAESLLGRWDLLYMDTTTRDAVRIQAPFVDTDETEEVVQKLKAKYMKWLSEEDVYHPEILEVLAGKTENLATIGSNDGWADSELIEQAIAVIAQSRKASATLLQRKLNVWFARAARIMDALEERWVIGPQDGAKPRDIYL